MHGGKYGEHMVIITALLITGISRVQVATKKNVMDFTPMLSSPSIIRDEDELRAFLLLKSK